MRAFDLVFFVMGDMRRSSECVNVLRMKVRNMVLFWLAVSAAGLLDLVMQ